MRVILWRSTPSILCFHALLIGFFISQTGGWDDCHFLDLEIVPTLVLAVCVVLDGQLNFFFLTISLVVRGSATVVVALASRG